MNRNLGEQGRGIGGGLGVFNQFVADTPLFRDCVFKHNYAAEGGGGVAVENGSGPVDFIDCTFESNVAPVDSEGAGAYVIGLDSVSEYVTFVNCTFRDNHAFSGVNNVGGLSARINARVRLWNSLFAGNIAHGLGAGAISVRRFASLEAVNCTIAGNTGSNAPGGVSVNTTGTVNIYNSILWYDSTPEIGGSTDANVEWSNVRGGWTGPGGDNIDADPKFVDMPNGDFRLDAANNSPSIDQGSIAELPCNEYWEELGTGGVPAPGCTPVQERISVDGHLLPRVANFPCGIVDQGAYEHQPEPEEKCADFNDDHVVDVSDLLILLSAWGPCGDPCNSCDEDLNSDGAVDVSDLLILLSRWGLPCDSLLTGLEVPETVQDCYDLYFDPVNPIKYEACLEMLQRLEE